MTRERNILTRFPGGRNRGRVHFDDVFQPIAGGDTVYFGSSADGKVVARSRQFETETVTQRVQPRAGATPYVRWGNWPVVLFSTGLLLFVWRGALHLSGAQKNPRPGLDEHGTGTGG